MLNEPIRTLSTFLSFSHSLSLSSRKWTFSKERFPFVSVAVQRRPPMDFIFRRHAVNAFINQRHAAAKDKVEFSSLPKDSKRAFFHCLNSEFRSRQCCQIVSIQFYQIYPSHQSLSIVFFNPTNILSEKNKNYFTKYSLF